MASHLGCLSRPTGSVLDSTVTGPRGSLAGEQDGLPTYPIQGRELVNESVLAVTLNEWVCRASNHESRKTDVSI